MALFDDLTKKAAKLTEEAIDNTQKFAGNAKIKLKIKNLESDRDDIYRELGQYYYEMIKDENSINEDIAELRQKIHDFDAEIKELQLQVQNDD